MSDGLTIRDARDDEIDIVASLTVDAYAEYAARMSPDAWSMFAQEIANVRGRMNDADIIVAEREGRLVGAVSLFGAWRGAQEGSVGVRLLAVPPQERGTGIGRALMTHCIDRARGMGASRVALSTTQEMDAARDLYDRLGFRRDPALDHERAPGVRLEGWTLDLT